MRVLLVGSGAREHAIADSLLRSPILTELITLPGNPGMARLGPAIDGVGVTDIGAIAAMSRVHDIDFVVVGPEAPLAAGLVDALDRLGIGAFGPTRAAARLEASKAFAKDVMVRAGVPTASAASFDQPDPAKDYLGASDGPYVVKADGLAAGKGVLVTESNDEARAWVDRCFEGGFGDAGTTVVIEEYLDGPELSMFAICDGTSAVTLQPARDYKRLGDGDVGPNTGGMGSYSPVDLPADLIETVERTVITPTLETMAADGNTYRGFLYAGLALTSAGPKVIEFNCRLGDPEAQVVLPRLETDLLGLLHAAATSALPTSALEWSLDACVNVVLASEGYPESPRRGDVIRGLDDVPAGTTIFHAGTARQHDHLTTDGGRVLSVVGRGSSLVEARTRAYEGVAAVQFDGMQYRTDIALS